MHRNIQVMTDFLTNRQAVGFIAMTGILAKQPRIPSAAPDPVLDLENTYFMAQDSHCDTLTETFPSFEAEAFGKAHEGILKGDKTLAEAVLAFLKEEIAPFLENNSVASGLGLELDNIAGVFSETIVFLTEIEIHPTYMKENLAEVSGSIFVIMKEQGLIDHIQVDDLVTIYDLKGFLTDTWMVQMGKVIELKKKAHPANGAAILASAQLASWLESQLKGLPSAPELKLLNDLALHLDVAPLPRATVSGLIDRFGDAAAKHEGVEIYDETMQVIASLQTLIGASMPDAPHSCGQEVAAEVDGDKITYPSHGLPATSTLGGNAR